MNRYSGGGRVSSEYPSFALHQAEPIRYAHAGRGKVRNARLFRIATLARRGRRTAKRPARCAAFCLITHTSARSADALHQKDFDRLARSVQVDCLR
ncbi:conserved hypothetical protein [Ricinus communis]|uniref:Uncharacterized protein n=1 Tax=Ricinus communis TaxID=3988 RepID=B9TC17_RICCO|nr:conserved hypothetical protein [Ricinus communis]